MAWVSPTFTSPWTDYTDTNYTPTQYMKDADGTVFIRGLVTRSTATPANATIFTLPAGFRPSKSIVFAGNWSGGPAVRFDVQSTGAVSWGGGDTTTIVSYTSITCCFKAEQ